MIKPFKYPKKMWFEKLTNKLRKDLKWYDLALIKLSIFFATLFLISVFPRLLNLALEANPWIFLVLSIAFALPVWKKMM